MTDVIVVGSGPGGLHAASRLVEAGLRVLLLDFGNRDERYAPLIPRRPFSDIRRSDPAQHRYLLGDRFEGIPFGPVRVGAQLTPPRMHILAGSRLGLNADPPGRLRSARSAVVAAQPLSRNRGRPSYSSYIMSR